MHIAIRHYHTDPASVDEITRRVNEGFIPRIKDVEGFLAYYVVDAGAGEVSTVSVFEDQAGAEESTRVAADWVRQNLAELLPDPPEITAGEVGAYEAASAGPVGAVTDTTSGVTDTVGGVTDTVGGVTDRLLGGLGDQERKRGEQGRERG
jgi:hypothetical protein